MASILVADSDAPTRSKIAQGLRDFGYSVGEAPTGITAYAQLKVRPPDLIICDYALPDIAGVELLADLRAKYSWRAIRVLITADDNPDEAVSAALSAGADDFIKKPINMAELIARVNACLRRPARNVAQKVLESNGIAIDTDSQRVTMDDETIGLAPREYALLCFLLANPDRVFSRQQLLLQIWNDDQSIGPRTVDVHIRRLRGLCEPFGYDKYIQTVRGAGYRFSLHE